MSYTQLDLLETSYDSIEALAADMRKCQRCALSKYRTNVVVGSGSIDSRIAVIAEMPGKVEDKEGVPMIGVSGEKLDGVLADAGIKREEIRFMNIVGCKTPVRTIDGNPMSRPPTSYERKACRYWWNEQLKLMKNLKVIVAMGWAAIEELIGRHVESVTNARNGGPYYYNGVRVVPTYNPAYLIPRRGTTMATLKNRKEAMVKDMLRVKQLSLA